MRWRENGAWLLTLLLLGTLLLAGCAKADAPTAKAPREDDAIVLAAYRHLAPGEHDGYYCSKILEVWEPLVTNDEETGRPAPCLARSWEMLDGGADGAFICAAACASMMGRNSRQMLCSRIWNDWKRA